MWRAHDGARLVQIPISQEYLTGFLSNGPLCTFGERISVTEGLPDGAKLVGSYQKANTVHLVYEHESFDPVERGNYIPEMMPVMHTEYEEDFMSVRVGHYKIYVPDGLEDDLDSVMTAGDWHDDWAELAEEDPLELRFFVADQLGIDVRHVSIERVYNAI